MNLPNFIDGKEGVYQNLPDADYRAASGVSNSMLKHIAADGHEPGSPAHFVSAFNQPQEDTGALFFGRMVHSKILTPNEPLPGVIEIPETYPSEDGRKKWAGNAKWCKAWLAAQEAAGLRPMKADAIKDMEEIVTAVVNHPIAGMAFRAGSPEVSLFKPFYRNEGMVLRKARLDWVPDGPCIVDIKTCQDARRLEFGKTMWKRRYFVQMAYYFDLWNELNPHDKKKSFIFIAVEKSAPYGIKVYNYSDETREMKVGRAEYERHLATVIACNKTGEWPAYSPEIDYAPMPEYVFKNGLEVYV